MSEHKHKWGLMWINEKVVALCINNLARVVTLEDLSAGNLPPEGCKAELSREEIERILNERENAGA